MKLKQIDNILHDVVIVLPIAASAEVCSKMITDACNTDTMYSFFAEKHDTTISIKLLFSQYKKYNTVKLEEAIRNICTMLETDNAVNTVYKQASLDVIIETYTPLITKLASAQQRAWQLEFDDLFQMCAMSITKLYNKGYYLHKRLIERSFINDVLMSLRHDKNKPQMFSLDYLAENGDGDSFDDSFGSQLEDLSSTEQMLEFEEEQDKNDTLDMWRQIVVDTVGQRQYNQLLLQYATHTVDTTTAKQMYELKKKFKGRY